MADLPISAKEDNSPAESSKGEGPDFATSAALTAEHLMHSGEDISLDFAPSLDDARANLPADGHDSAVAHAQGSALYIDDIPERGGLLHIAPGFCRNAVKARILGMDLEAVRRFPGVVAVITAEDIPAKNDCSPSLGDDPIIAHSHTRFFGEVVFAVLAKTHDIARRAARLAEIDVMGEQANIAPHREHNFSEKILPDYSFTRADHDAAIAGAPYSLSGSLEMGGQDHFYLEGQIALAQPGEGDSMHIYSSSQDLAGVQGNIAAMLGVPLSKVTVENRRMGGAFGGKESQASQWACLAALGALVTGKACKLRLDREDDMIMTGKRHEVMADWTVGYDDGGVVTGVDLALDLRCGCSADLSQGVADRTMFHADSAYYYPAARILSRRLKSDTCSNTAFRGFGGPQGMLAAERIMDAIAVKQGADPLNIRRANLYRAGHDTTVYGMPVEYHSRLQDIMDQLEASSQYWARREKISEYNSNSAILKRGMALTPVKFGIAFTLKQLNQAGALVHLYRDGSVHINHSGTEMGQGLNQKVRQSVGEKFGIDCAHIHINAASTEKVPNSAPTAASSGADLNAMAARQATEKIKKRLINFIIQQFQAKEEEISFANNQIHFANRSIAFSDLAAMAQGERISLSATGFFATPRLDWDRETVSGRPFAYFAFGAACSEVCIDSLTGELHLERVDILHDAGHSTNRAIDLGQIEGGFVQGLGWLTSEELYWDELGKLKTYSPSTYKIPTSGAIPDAFHVSFYEGSPEPDTILSGAKATGEPPVMLANSVFSAIFDALASLRPGVVPSLNAPATPNNIADAAKALRQLRPE